MKPRARQHRGARTGIVVWSVTSEIATGYGLSLDTAYEAWRRSMARTSGMTASSYYNEIDPFAAQWLRNLISAGYISPGDVDERSIPRWLIGFQGERDDCAPSAMPSYRNSRRSSSKR